MRGLYTELVGSGEIDEANCTCRFRNHSMYHDFEAKKQAIIDRLNVVLADANLPTIRGVFWR
ncbi:MAG: hypothetical protein K2R98_30170 [Gemmataceae bacterium]|nr:hypothetical protein [Gemmataceae bacterium]